MHHFNSNGIVLIIVPVSSAPLIEHPIKFLLHLLLEAEESVPHGIRQCALRERLLDLQGPNRVVSINAQEDQDYEEHRQLRVLISLVPESDELDEELYGVEEEAEDGERAVPEEHALAALGVVHEDLGDALRDSLVDCLQRVMSLRERQLGDDVVGAWHPGSEVEAHDAPRHVEHVQPHVREETGCGAEEGKSQHDQGHLCDTGPEDPVLQLILRSMRHTLAYEEKLDLHCEVHVGQALGHLLHTRPQRLRRCHPRVL